MGGNTDLHWWKVRICSETVAGEKRIILKSESFPFSNAKQANFWKIRHILAWRESSSNQPSCICFAVCPSAIQDYHTEQINKTICLNVLCLSLLKAQSSRANRRICRDPVSLWSSLFECATGCRTSAWGVFLIIPTELLPAFIQACFWGCLSAISSSFRIHWWIPIYCHRDLVLPTETAVIIFCHRKDGGVLCLKAKCPGCHWLDSASFPRWLMWAKPCHKFT